MLPKHWEYNPLPVGRAEVSKPHKDASDAMTEFVVALNSLPEVKRKNLELEIEACDYEINLLEVRIEKVKQEREHYANELKALNDK